MVAALDGIGALKKDGKHRQAKRRIPDQDLKARCYVIDHNTLFSSKDDE